MARNMEDDIFTPEEAAEALGVKLMTLYQWVHRKKIKCFRIGYGQQRIRFRRREVESLIERRSGAEAEKAEAKKKTAKREMEKSARINSKKIDLDDVVKESLRLKGK